MTDWQRHFPNGQKQNALFPDLFWQRLAIVQQVQGGFPAAAAVVVADYVDLDRRVVVEQLELPSVFMEKIL